MGTILASAVIAKSRLILKDSAGTRWTDAELLGWLNEAQRYIAAQRPDASSTLGNITLVQGTKQTIPSGGLRLLDVKRNMGSDGSTAGRVITIIDEALLSAHKPSWHTETAAASTKHYIFDERAPTTFYVYPPGVAGQKIESLYSVAPDDIPDTDSAITLDDIYEPPMLDYMLSRAKAKNAEYQDPVGAAFHMNACNVALGIKTKVDAVAGPNRNAPPYNPSSAGGVR